MSKGKNAKLDTMLAFESGQLDETETVAMFQTLIDDGSVWKLQGSYGRAAMDLVRAGRCTLGPNGCRDYFGNYVPSRFEVEPGTPGSIDFVNEQSLGNRY